MYLMIQDRPLEVNKEGCARVFAFRACNSPHSYTLEFGMHSTQEFNQVAESSNTGFVVSEHFYLH